MTKKIIKLNTKDIKYISEKQNTNWNGDLDGSILQMCIDGAIKGFVRIGLDESNNVIFFKESDFNSYLDNLSLKLKSSLVKAEIEWFNDDGLSEFEIFEENLYEVINDFYKVKTLYINSFDYIRDYFNIIECSNTVNSSLGNRSGFYTEDIKGEVLFLNCSKLTSNIEQIRDIADELLEQEKACIDTFCLFNKPLPNEIEDNLRKLGVSSFGHILSELEGAYSKDEKVLFDTISPYL